MSEPVADPAHGHMNGPDRRRDRRLYLLAGLGAAQVALYLASAVIAPTDAPMRALLPVLAAFVLYLLSLRTARGALTPATLAVVIAIAVLCRAMLLPEDPFLSDDHHRYLWDGRVQLEGINPYRHAPADPALAGIDDTLRSRVNHPHVHTIYPPFAQLAFLAAATLPGSLSTLKLLWLACDLAIGLLLYRTLPPARRLHGLLLYAWSPLVIVEVAWNAHLDLLGVVFLVAAIRLAGFGDRRAAVRARALAIGAALAGAALVKYFAAALVPAAARTAPRARSDRPSPARSSVTAGSLPLAAAFASLAGLLYLPYAGAGRSILSGLWTYAESWRFNDGLYAVLAWLAPSGTAARLIAAALVLLLIVSSVRNRWSLERAALWITGAILILSPTVHPWYLLWMIPLVTLRPSRAWLYLSGSVFLAYLGLGIYRATGVWPEPLPAKLLIWAPFFVLLIADGWRGSWWQLAVREAFAPWFRRRG